MYQSPAARISPSPARRLSRRFSKWGVNQFIQTDERKKVDSYQFFACRKNASVKESIILAGVKFGVKFVRCSFLAGRLNLNSLWNAKSAAGILCFASSQKNVSGML